jgi:hypothetical protein
MSKKLLWIAVAIFALSAPAILLGWTENEFFKLEDLRPGMKGIGKTCYQGDKPEEFQVEILGILHGVNNPGSNAVLARLSGTQADKTGVFEGMSGSPVYIDGKLLGAVAFSFTFAKEPICGITPIKEMVDSFSGKQASSGSKAAIKKSMLWRYRIAPQNATSIFSGFPNEAGKFQNSMSVMGGHALTPIATPLSLSGLNVGTIKLFESQVRAFGMSFLQGAGRTVLPSSAKSVEESKSSLEPGSNIVVSLIKGDLDISAGGTVTYVDGNKLYAFGHNMFQLGFTELPMHKARAVMVVPSVENSFKILETGDVVGTISQDRGQGIYGIIGDKPNMVPLKIRVSTSRGVQRVYKYELARDSFLTPILVNMAVYNTIISSERAQGPATFSVSGTIDIRDEEPVEINSRFSVDSDAAKLSALSVAVPLNYIMSAGYKKFDLEKIELDVSAQESDQSAVLDSIRLERSELKAGETVDLEISYKRANGEIQQDSYPVKIPENVTPGVLNLLVADGNQLMSLDEEEEGDILVPRDLTQLIRFINNIRKNDHLYVRLFRNESGVAINGEGLPGLPPSMLSILKSERKSGSVIPIRTSTFMEYELPPSDYIAAGAKVLKLTVKP